MTFIRHGETDANKEKRMCDGNADFGLNEMGRQQAKDAAKRLQSEGKTFTRIIASPLSRAQETAQIIRDVLAPGVSIETMDALTEAKSSHSGETYQELIETYEKMTGKKWDHTQALIRLQEALDGESLHDLEQRAGMCFEDITTRLRDENVLVVGHGGFGRLLKKYVYSLEEHEAYTARDRLANCESWDLPMARIVSPLDRYLVAELNTFVARFTDGMDRYDLQSAVRSISDIVDTLTNWYIRRSRRRFWADGLTDDKKSAYETLHRTLTTICQVIAPITPFISDALYQRLTDEESVHLTRFPMFRKHEIASSVLTQMREVRNLVTLGLASRARAKIRVRQPLQ